MFELISMKKILVVISLLFGCSEQEINAREEKIIDHCKEQALRWAKDLDIEVQTIRCTKRMTPLSDTIFRDCDLKTNYNELIGLSCSKYDCHRKIRNS